MATTSYYVAVSLDGFIAREDEVMDWLSNYTAPLETPTIMNRFIRPSPLSLWAGKPTIKF